MDRAATKDDVAQRAAETERQAVVGLAWVRLVLREMEHHGSGADSVWELFWIVFPRLSDRAIRRIVVAAGERGRDLRPVISAEQRLRRYLACPAKR